MTYIDAIMGLPTMVICVQMVPLSFLVLYAYSAKPYEISNSRRTLRPQVYQTVESDDDGEILMSGFQKRYQGGRWGLRAWAVYLNPLELLRDVKAAYVMIHSARALQKAHAKEREMARYETRHDSGEGA